MGEMSQDVSREDWVKKLRIIYIYTIRYGFSKSQNDKNP